MINKINNTKNVILGMLIGGLAGATAMLLLAPQSGKQTRAEIQLRSIQLRDRTTDMVKKEIEQVRFDAHKIKTDFQEKAVQLKHLGQEKVVEQMDHVSSALDAGIMAVEAA
jgi:gas vesicle protein